MLGLLDIVCVPASLQEVPVGVTAFRHRMLKAKVASTGLKGKRFQVLKTVSDFKGAALVIAKKTLNPTP